MSTSARTPARRNTRRLTTLLCVIATMALSAPAVAQEGPPPSAAGAPTSTAAEGGGDAAAPGGEGGDSLNIGRRNNISRVRGVRRNTPEIHTVRQGDTLWDITRAYFRNPYLWPALWSYNPHITNPHWIYPGDLVFLKPANGGGGGGSGSSAGDLLGFNQQRGTMVVAAGYYDDEEDLKDAGRLVFSPEEKAMLTVLDEAYIDWADEEVRKRAPVGQRLGIYHVEEAVVDPDSDEEVAKKLILVGTLQITFNDGESLPGAVITDAIREIERGDVLLPLEDSLFRLESRTNATDAEARIIDSFDLVTQLGEQQFVLVNRGSEDGVSVGNRFLVFEQREGIYDLPEDEEKEEEREKKQEEESAEKRERQEATYNRAGDEYWPRGEMPQAPHFPPEDDDNEENFSDDREYTQDDLPLRLIGEVIIVKTNSRFATALIVDSRREFQIGQGVTMLSNY